MIIFSQNVTIECFFKARKGPDYQRWIGGCKKCQCHTEDEFQQMKGQMTNHQSGPLANLSFYGRMLEGKARAFNSSI